MKPEPLPLISPNEALGLMPFKVAMRELRRRAIALGACYKHGHAITFTAQHIEVLRESFLCPTSNYSPTQKQASITLKGRSKSRGVRGASELEKARALLISATPKRTATSSAPK